MSDDPLRNRLGSERSPYLRQHADNPVAWQPWGPEAIERARAADLPIFLSIGYTACHWCHVMERECFGDAEIAGVMNAVQVNVKVDREERPDLDQIYMQAVITMTGQGGWPLNVWLTPDLEPFYGGTYFPPVSRWGQPAFVDVLRAIAAVYSDRREQVLSRVAEVRRVLESSAGRGGGSGEGGLSPDLPLRAVRNLVASWDRTWGGFGDAPKFPRPTALSLLAHAAGSEPEGEAARALDHTLEMMWRGGIYDHVSGGFARYATDVRWRVPHFEKMLDDNSLLVECYLDGHLLLDRPAYGAVARDILGFLEREMTLPEGAFCSSLDADNAEGEGRFHVFTPQDLEAALGADAVRAARIHGVTEAGQVEGGSVLHWPHSPAETAVREGLAEDELAGLVAAFRLRLREWRAGRPAPPRDEKVIASSNGLAIAAFARAGVVLDEPRWIGVAGRAALFAERELMTPDGSLLRRWCDGEARFAAGLDDHAFLAWGFLRLFEVTGAAHWLSRVLDLMAAAHRRFADPDGGAYWFAEPADDLIVRLKDSDDGARPAGNGVMARLWGRLGAILGREDLRARGLAIVAAFSDVLERWPDGHPTLVQACSELSGPPEVLFLAGQPESEAWAELLGAAWREPRPARVVVPVPDAQRGALAALGVPVAGKEPRDRAAQAFLCQDGACHSWPLRG